ncbi:potassium/sodium hyperpolarization-activated cyclic nucleotide-gated channel 3-like [Sitophilus oryzae]|uniref:Potassium/sodium hyperpolarization-activated cyclic nucleotide-gated channel 3-like n=1 Tax=Sitophilus oryzae TaxID=7048 RepID=A0A6J2XAZ5_SITOR|nr:potassium/sodium hyperpolarization-activated cyclic nucleotide-gated channel 3-like [Sitophilus oryzae]
MKLDQHSDMISRNSEIVFPPDVHGASGWQAFKLSFRRISLVSERHPIVLEYFNSEVALLNEKKRQVYFYPYTIHPLSIFKQMYDIFAFFFYGPLVILKLLDWSFISAEAMYMSRPLMMMVLIFDVISGVNVILEFFTGYAVPKTKRIELSRIKIAKKYIFSGLFFCDVLSGVPEVFFSYPLIPKIPYLILKTCILLKLMRMITFFVSFKSMATYFTMGPQKVFIISFFLFTLFTMHFMTCLHVGVPQYRFIMTGLHHKESWLTQEFMKQGLRTQYITTFFRTAQYTMLISLPNISIPYKLVEEVSVASFNYFAGKLMLTVTWIILLHNFVSQNSVRIKFREVMKELEEYIKAKQISQDLKRRLITYYTYKYQRVFFNERFIKNMFSENLKKEIDVFLCKTLINSVTIFSKLSPKEVEQVVAYLVPEIFLPNEIITQSGTPAESMYFLESGTVAVFTPSGKEINHLQDGAHFGEVAILVKEKHRSASVVAIEISRVYKLSRNDFDKCFRNNAKVYDSLLKLAEDRLKKVRGLEERYKKELFEMTYMSSMKNNTETNEKE